MGNNSQSNRFPLPDNWNVDEVICCVVPIPNDPQYISMFRGLLETLTWQRSFRLHPTENAAYQVSKTWQSALESRELSFIDCEDQLYILRLKPDDPLTTQASTDGENWFDIFRNCCPADVLFPPDLSNPDDADLAAIQMIRVFHETIIQEIIDCIADSTPKEECVNHIMDTLSPYGAGASVRSSISKVFDFVSDSGDPTPYTTDCVYEPCWRTLADFLHDNPTSYLDGLSAFLFDWLDCASDEIFETLNKAAAQLGGTGLFNIWQAGGGGGAGFDEPFGSNDTQYDHYWDFAVNDGGWHLDDRNGTIGPNLAGQYAGGAWAFKWFAAYGLSLLRVHTPAIDEQVLSHFKAEYLIPSALTGVTFCEVIIASGFDTVAVIPMPTDVGANVFEWDGYARFTDIAVIFESTVNEEFYLTAFTPTVACVDPYA